MFIFMQRGISASTAPGEDQNEFNENYELDTGEDLTSDFESWKGLLAKNRVLFVHQNGIYMVDDDPFGTKADDGSIYIEKKAKKVEVVFRLMNSASVM